MNATLLPGDVVLTRSTSVLGRLIRICTRSFGEKRSKVNHVGIIVDGGVIHEAVLVEALLNVCRHGLWEHYAGTANEVAVYRATNVPSQDMQTVVAEAEEQVGKKYGFGKIIAHFLDWLLTGAYVFRRLTQNGDYPICSWLVAHAYAKAGYNFGVEPGAADPDDIWDFVDERTDYYDCIVPLGPLDRSS